MKRKYEKYTDTTKFKKGKLAEDIVKNLLNRNKYLIYDPFIGEDKSKWEFFDFMAMKHDARTESHKPFIADVKSKARMNYFNAVGIDLRHYKKYANMAKELKMPFKLFVVDEFFGKIYGINITKEMILPENLKTDSKDGYQYPMIKDFKSPDGLDKMILFSYEHAIEIATLSKQHIKELRKLNNRPQYNLKDFDNSFTEEQKKLCK